MLKRWARKRWGLCLYMAVLGCAGSADKQDSSSDASATDASESASAGSSDGGPTGDAADITDGATPTGDGGSSAVDAWPIQLGDPAQVEVAFAHTDGASNLFLGTTTQATVRLGDPGSAAAPVGGQDAFLASLGQGGAVRWARYLGSPGADLLESLAVTTQGQIYVVLILEQDAMLDGTPYPAGRHLVGLSAEGTLTWSRPLPTGGSCGLAASPDGRAWLGCGFEGNYNAGEGELNTSGGHALLLAAFDSAGTLLRAQAFTPELDRELAVHALAIAGGNVCLYASTALAGIDVGGGVVNADLLLACFDPLNGNHTYSRGFPGAAEHVHMAGSDELLTITDVLGRFSGPDFGSGPITGAEGTTFVAALAAADGSEVSVYLPNFLCHSAQPDGHGGIFVTGRQGDAPILQHTDASFNADWTVRRTDDSNAVSTLATGSGPPTVVDSGAWLSVTRYQTDGDVTHSGAARPWLNPTPQRPVGLIDLGAGNVRVGLNFDYAFQVATERQSAGAESLGFGTFNEYGSLARHAAYGSASEQALGAVAGDSVRSYAVGRFRNRLSFGGHNLSVASGFDAFVAAFDAEGQPRWARRFGLDADDMFHAAALGPDGGVIAAGTFGDRLANFAVPHLAVVSLSESGEPRWSTHVDSASVAAALGLAVDSEGIYAVGQYKGTSTFGELALDVPEAAFFVTHLSTAGTPEWVVHGDSAGRATAVTLSDSAEAYVAGHITAAGSLCGASVGQQAELVLLRLDSSGTCSLIGRVVGDIELRQLAFDRAGALWGAGAVQGATTLGGTALAGTSQDALVVRFDVNTGAATWARRFGGELEDVATGITVTEDDVVHVTGEFRGLAHLGFDTNSTEFEADATGDGFIMRFATP